MTSWEKHATGASGNIVLERAWLRAASKAFDIFCQKNHDYGSDNLSVMWLPGVAIRLGDKVSRLWGLTGLRGEDLTPVVADESISDTLLDTLNYAMVGYLMITNQWHKINVDDYFKFNPGDE